MAARTKVLRANYKVVLTLLEPATSNASVLSSSGIRQDKLITFILSLPNVGSQLLENKER